MIVRNLTFADRLPEAITGGGVLHFTPELTWVACDGPKMVGVLVAFAAHGIFYPFRIQVLPEAPYGCALRLLRKAFTDAMLRGYTAFYSYFSTEDAVGRRFLKILESRGAPFTTECFQMVMISGVIAPLLALPAPAPMKAVS